MASNASKLGSPAPEEKKNNNVIQEHYRLVLQWISNELSIKDENPWHWEKAPVKPVSFWLSPKAKKKNKKHVWNIVFSPLFYQARKCSDLLINLNLWLVWINWIKHIYLPFC